MLHLRSSIAFGYNQELIFKGFLQIVKSFTKLKIIGGWPNGLPLMNELKKIQPDILIIEFGNPSNCHAEYLEMIKNKVNTGKIIVISSNVGFSTVNKFIKLDIGGIIFKDCNTDEFLNALKKISYGENYYCSEIAKLVLTNFKEKTNTRYKLTNREKAVLRLIMEGNSGSSISAQLKITESTVKTHKRNIMAKLGVTSTINLLKLVCKDSHLSHFKTGFCKDCPYNIRWN